MTPGAKNTGMNVRDKNGATQRPQKQTNCEGIAMKGFVKDIEGLAVKNEEFRRVLYTARHCQLVVMALEPKEEKGPTIRCSCPARRVA